MYVHIFILYLLFGRVFLVVLFYWYGFVLGSLSKKLVTIYGGHNSDDNESFALMAEHIQKTGL